MEIQVQIRKVEMRNKHRNILSNGWQQMSQIIKIPIFLVTTDSIKEKERNGSHQIANCPTFFPEAY